VVWTVWGASPPAHATSGEAATTLANGVVWMVLVFPFLVDWMIPTWSVFELVSWLFAKEQKIQDGVVIASLLEEGTPKVGATWWVHDDAAYAATPPRTKKWYKGAVVESVQGKNFIVEVEDPGELPVGGSVKKRHEFAANTTMEPAELQKLGLDTLCCIRFEQVTLELLSSDNPNPTPATCKMATKCKPGEIDWFISHSWHDDPVTKWEALQEEAALFKVEHGRYPVLWLDKVCINQEQIQESLKCLPVYLLACNAMMVLGGESYLKRLWCVWELYTIFAVSGGGRLGEGSGLELLIREFGTAHADNVNHSMNKSLKAQVQNFEMGETSHCYDPNEEGKLQRAIRSSPGGEEGFNKTIRGLHHHVEHWITIAEEKRTRIMSLHQIALSGIVVKRAERGSNVVKKVRKVRSHKLNTLEAMRLKDDMDLSDGGDVDNDGVPDAWTKRDERAIKKRNSEGGGTSTSTGGGKGQKRKSEGGNGSKKQRKNSKKQRKNSKKLSDFLTQGSDGDGGGGGGASADSAAAAAPVDVGVHEVSPAVIVDLSCLDDE